MAVLKHCQHQHVWPALGLGSLFQPAALISFPAGLDIHDCDHNRELAEKMYLLPIESFVPFRRAVEKSSDQKAQTFVHWFDSEVVFPHLDAIRQDTRLCGI